MSLGELLVEHGDDVVHLFREVVNAIKRRKGDVRAVIDHLRALGPVERVDLEAIADQAKASIRENRD